METLMTAQTRAKTTRAKTTRGKTMIRGLLAILLASAFCVAMLNAQATDGNLVGAVTDPAGMQVPNASVVATNRDTGVKYTTTTNAEGEFRLNNIPVGNYDVDTTAGGMAPSKVSGVALDLNRTVTLNIKVVVASATTIVEVVEAPALIDTSSAQLQNVFSGDLALNLPSTGKLRK